MTQIFEVKTGTRHCLTPSCSLIGGNFEARWMEGAKPMCPNCETDNNISVEVKAVSRATLRVGADTPMYREVEKSDYSGLAKSQTFEYSKYQEFYENRKPTSHTTVGLDEMDKVVLKDNPAKVIHEEVDQHSGAVELWIQESSQTDSGTVIQKWEPSGPRRLTKVDQKKTRD